MNEDFLHYIWKYRLFESKKLETTSGESLEIIKPGEHNTDGGPDFHNARIKIDKTLWAGNIEIHINASDWVKHGHQNDNAYDNIILHVVHSNDIEIKRKNKEIIPTLELKELIPLNVFRRYKNMMNSKQWIPCQKLIKQAESIVINSWLERILIEKLENKTEFIIRLLEQTKNNWEQSFYICLARNFGFKLNAEAFELLARSTPLSVIGKHKNSLFQIESIYFGQAGLLNNSPKEEYATSLLHEFKLLKQKFGLSPIPAHIWKFLRLQPSGFPTLRIAQFSSLMHKTSHLFSKILETTKINELENLFQCSCSEYWDTHYVFGKESPKRLKNMGKTAIENIIINTIVPFLFIYGEHTKEEKYKERAIRFLEQLDGEKNAIITQWKLMEMPVKTAANTQALIELKNNYCNKKKCLNCALGSHLLNRAK